MPFGVGGESIGTAYVRVIMQGDDSDLKHLAKEREPQLKKIGTDQGDTLGKSFRHAYDKEIDRDGGLLSDKDIDHIFARRRGRMEAVAQKMSNIFTSRFEKNLRADLRNFGPKVADEVLLGFKKRAAASGDVFGSVQHDLRNLEVHAANAAREVGHLDDRFGHIRANAHKFADAVGGVLGRGSRNNFLNFFGSLARNGVRFFTELGITGLKVFQGLTVVGTDMFHAFTEGFDTAKAAGAGFFGSLTTGLTEGVKNGGAAFRAAFENLPGLIAAVVTGLTVMTVVVGPLVTAIVGLAASVISLAGSLTFALAAGFAPLVGILTPLALGLGFAATTFGTMTKEAHVAFIEGLQPLHNILVDMAKLSQKEILRPFGDQMKELATNLKSAGTAGLFTTVGKSFSDFIGQVTKATGSGVFKQFTKDLDNFIPLLSERLGTATISAGAGLAGVFRAALPATIQFLDGLTKITNQFAVFANSARGQNAMKQFFDEAIVSAKVVGGLLKQTGGLIKDLFVEGGKDAGDSLFKSLGDNIKRLRDFIQKNPGKVRKFFADAADVASLLGSAIVAIVVALGKLNTEGNKLLLEAILLAVVKTAFVLADVIGLAGDAIFALVHPIRFIAGEFAKLYRFVAKGFDLIGLHSAADSIRATAKTVQDFRDGPKVKIGVDDKDIKFTAEELKALGLEVKKPKKVKVDSKEVTKAKDVLEDLARQLGLTKQEAEEVRVKVEKQQLADAKKLLTDFRTVLGLGLPDLKPKVDPKPIKDATKNLTDFQKLLLGIPDEITVDLKVNTDAVRAALRAFAIFNPFLRSGGVPLFASGGVPNFGSGGFGGNVNSSRLIRAGEAGFPEAVVPLNRPLAQVDPSVRMLSAIAQGKIAVGGDTTKTVNIGSINSNSTDATTVAQEALNLIFGRLI